MTLPKGTDNVTQLVEGQLYQHGDQLLRAEHLAGTWCLIRVNDDTIPPGAIHALREVVGGWLEISMGPGSAELVDGALLTLDLAALVPVATDCNFHTLDDEFYALMAPLSWEWS